MNQLPNLISISGAISSGKDEVAKMIQQRQADFGGMPHVIKRFAGKLKIIAGVLLGVSQTKLEDREFKESYLPDFDMTVRRFLQLVGTNCLRSGLHEDIWVMSLFREFDDSSRWIIPDARFANEINAIKSRGGVCIRVDRPELAEDNHNSEVEWRTLPFDYVINNSGSLDDLRTQVQQMLEYFGKRENWFKDLHR